MDLDLRGKRVLVTGGSRGIGRGVATAFAREGADLCLIARSADALADAAGDIRRETGVTVATAALDLAAPGAPEQALAAAGAVDILINNAGAIPPGDLQAVDEAAWRTGWDLKVFGYVNLCRRAYPAMKAAGGGVILNVIGNGGEITDPAYIAGGTGNAALMHFTRSLGGESLADGIRVLGVNPGPVETDRIVRLLKARARSTLGDEGRYREFMARYPLGRPARVSEVADLVVFLASPRAAYVSGTVVTIDGGIAARRSIA